MIHEQKALRAASAATIGFGLLIAAGAHPLTGGLTHLLGDVLLWPMDGMEQGATREARLLYAIAGGLMAGMGWMLWELSGRDYAQDRALARRIIVGGLAVWFVVDCTASVAAGGAWNVLANSAFLSLFALPLWRGRGKSQPTER
ncbi:hypothetical protein [Neogemmobacter tilapiae]|uniref:Uncharacterized protein n=1 Tax=Neogemmobacter tilapiae TaxID=875041 RepID=A0A918TF80_9RHOB|nr:hypothetical protein [Gemmobacter tilapiae]GHC45488.1 hypothetical protein GCM10007315_03650 [Gemmobacter tilapiae]